MKLAFSFSILFLLSGFNLAEARSNRTPAGSQSTIRDDGNACAPYIVSANTTTVVAVSTRTAVTISTTNALSSQNPEISQRRRITIQLASYSTDSFGVCLGTSTSMPCSTTSTGVLLTTQVPANTVSYESYGQEPIYALGIGGQGAAAGTARLRGCEWYDNGDIVD